MRLGGGYRDGFPHAGVARKHAPARRGHLHALPHRPHHGVRRSAPLLLDRGGCRSMRSRETMRDLERVSDFAFKAGTVTRGYLEPEPHIVDGPFELGATTITPLPVPHGDSIVNGYLFSRGGEKLVAYLSDCSACRRRLRGRSPASSAGDRRASAQAAPDAPERGEALEVAARVRPSRLSSPMSATSFRNRRRLNCPRRRHRLRRAEARTLG